MFSKKNIAVDKSKTTRDVRGGIVFVQLRNSDGDVVGEGSGRDERAARIRAKTRHAGGHHGRLR